MDESNINIDNIFKLCETAIFIDHTNIDLFAKYHSSLSNSKKRVRIRIDLRFLMAQICVNKKIIYKSVAGSFNLRNKNYKKDNRLHNEEDIYKELGFNIIASQIKGKKETHIDGAIANDIINFSKFNPLAEIIVLSGDINENKYGISIEEAIQIAKQNGNKVERYGFEGMNCDQVINENCLFKY